MSQGLAGVRRAAREHKEIKFTALLHHLTVDLLRESFYSLKRKAAPGVDGMTWQEYESGLENRLVDLHGRVHRGAYRARPSRRVYIQKEDGRRRQLGVAALEDKIVQQAAVTILNQIYEEDCRSWISQGLLLKVSSRSSSAAMAFNFSGSLSSAKTLMRARIRYSFSKANTMPRFEQLWGRQGGNVWRITRIGH